MKKASKITLVILACIVSFYGIFVALDCIRLKSAQKGTKPLITISEDKENHTYNGLGYSVKYYLDENETSYKNAYGAESRLFGRFLLWAYVEDKAAGGNTQTEPQWQYTPMVMVNGELYYDTGIRSDEAKCGVMDGEITSQVSSNQRPNKNNQSNFGTGYGYQFGQEGTINIYINGAWNVFAVK